MLSAAQLDSRFIAAFVRGVHFISIGSVFTGVLVRGVLALRVLVRGVPESAALVLGEAFSCLVCDFVDERRFFTLPASFLLSLLKSTKTATRKTTMKFLSTGTGYLQADTCTHSLGSIRV